MKIPYYKISAYLRYRRRSKHYKGFGVHSPFVFHWLNHVLYEKDFFYAYQMLRTIRKELLSNKTEISLAGFGTSPARTTTIGEIAKKSTTKQKYAELLFRITNNTNAQYIVELGTNIGLTTMHLAAANSQANVITIEGEPSLCDIAKRNFTQHNLTNITTIQGDIDLMLPEMLEKLPRLDIVFFDANHTYEATISYFEHCLPKAHSKTVFIFDDIHWSEEMELAWNKIRQHPKIRVDMDLFQMGITLFNPDLQKESYIVKF